MKCEEVLLAKMAEIDGESTENVETHLASCENCQREIASMRALDHMFDRHERVESDADLWPAVSERVTQRSGSAGWLTFGVFALALITFKIAGLSFDNEAASFFGVVPLVLGALLFVLLKENPFKVSTELILESHHE